MLLPLCCGHSTMKLRILEPARIGLMSHHKGKIYDAEKVKGGFLVRITPKSGFDYQIRVSDRAKDRGEVEVIEEELFIPYAMVSWP